MKILQQYDFKIQHIWNIKAGKTKKVLNVALFYKEKVKFYVEKIHNLFLLNGVFRMEVV